MKVCAGTRNPCKILGIKQAFTEAFKSSVNIVAVTVETEVPRQPIGLHQIVKGAMQRCVKAFKLVSNADFSVGVEAGIYSLGSKFFDVQVACVMDSKGRYSLGMSPSFQIPPEFAHQLINGSKPELEVVVDEYFGTKDIGEKGGLISLLTKGAVSREHLTRDAVLMALIPWMNEDLYIKLKGRKY